MNYKDLIKKINPEINKIISFLENEIGKVRGGRLTPGLIENIIIDCFNQKFPLKQLAVIFVSENNQILIQPWDYSYVEPIVSGLKKTNLGVNPVVEKNVIRLVLPSLTEEYRKNLIKVLSEKQEAARQSVRKWREQAWKEIQDGFQEGEIREDDKYRAKDELQEIIDESNKKIEEIIERKKKEILE